MLTPLDIENKKFAKQMMNGYNVDEVDEFLDQITLDYERLYKENADLKKNNEELTSSMSQYKAVEETLKSTLIMAQSTAEEVKSVARKEAEQIINEAETAAKASVATLENEILLKKKELEDVEKQFDVYKAKMESLLISQLELLKEVNKE